MNTKHLVDPEIAPLLDQFPTLQFTLETLPQIRAFGAEMFEHQKALLPEFPDINATERYIPGSQGACWYTSRRMPHVRCPRSSGFTAAAT